MALKERKGRRRKEKEGEGKKGGGREEQETDRQRHSLTNTQRDRLAPREKNNGTLI